jgi:cell division protein ZipA
VDFDFRDWLIIVGIVAVVGVLLHGFWRMWTDSERLTVKLDKTFMSASSLDAEQNDLGLFKAELPNGGARIVKVGASNIPVPNQISDAGKAIQGSSQPVQNEGPSETADAETSADRTQPRENPQNSLFEAESESDSGQSEVSGAVQSQSRETDSPTAEVLPGDLTIEENYVVINVLGEIQGKLLFESLQNLGFAFGEMNIFHFNSAESEIEFSLANAVEPGNFDLEQIDELVTPGVILFMRAHEMKDPLACFEQMLGAGVRLAEDLAGQLCDESRSMMTEQTIEHRKQDLQDYKFRRMR